MLSYTEKPNAVRRLMRFSLEWMNRIKGVDVILFFIVMLLKQLWFNKLIHVPNMDMDGYDTVVAIGTLALVTFWTFWLPTRGRIIALIALNLLLSFIMYADLIYYRYFQDFISVPVLLQANQVDSLGESIGTLMHAKDFLLGVDWLLIIPFGVYVIWKGRSDLRRDSHGYGYGYSSQRKTPFWRKAVIRIAVSAAIFAIGMSMSIGNVNEAKKTWALGLFDGNWWNVSLYNVTGIVGFHGYDVYRYAKLHWIDSEQASAEETAEAMAWTEARGDKRQSLESDPTFGEYKGSNVIVVQMEAFQNFMIGKSVGGQEITPNLNKLVKESAYFSQFYHQTAQGRTSDADFLSNCSLQPMMSGSVFIQYPNHQYNCMTSTLKDNGYATAAFHAYEGGFWNRNTMYANMGYDTFYRKKNYEREEPVGWSLGDNSFFRQSVDLMAKEQQPFYSFLITLSSHYPFTMPESERKLNVGELDGTIMGDYLQAVHYVDASIGTFIDRLKAEGLWNNTIVAFYGDHDNSIRDWSLFETFLGQPLNDLQREMILKQVPFIVHLPDGKYAGTHANVGGQLDVTPTILHLLGISTADMTLLGQPLLTSQPQSKLVVQRNGAFTDGTVYYMPSGDAVAENGKCWNIAANKLGDVQKCLGAVEDARTELSMSDQIVQHDLIASFRAAAVEASADGGAATAVNTSGAGK